MRAKIKRIDVKLLQRHFNVILFIAVVVFLKSDSYFEWHQHWFIFNFFDKATNIWRHAIDTANVRTKWNLMDFTLVVEQFFYMAFLTLDVADLTGKIFRLILAFDNQWQSTQCIQYIFLLFLVNKHLGESLGDIQQKKSFHFHPYHQFRLFTELNWISAL